MSLDFAVPEDALAAILGIMADMDAARMGKNGIKVTVHELGQDGNPGPQLGTATIIGADAVALDFEISTLPVPLCLAVPADAVLDTNAGRRLIDDSFLFEVATIHISLVPTAGDSVPMTDLPKTNGPQVALEIPSKALRLTVPMGKSARSFWCILFPRMAACVPRR